MELCSYSVLALAIVLCFNHCCVRCFSRQECLSAHNNLRAKHADTPFLQYSAELEQEAQKYADELGRTDEGHEVFPTRRIPKRRRSVEATPNLFQHKEMWDGEVSFPPSKWDLNRDRKVPIGESIHKFCCYSYPYCPKEFFYELDFPPSSTAIAQQWYGTEIDNYDFQRGIKKRQDEDIEHFTNIVWASTTEIGCAQSVRSPKGCIYTVVRYRSQGSIGVPSKFRDNVKRLKTNAEKEHSKSNGTVLTVFLVISLLLLVFIFCVIAYFKREAIRHKYSEFLIMRNISRSERGPGKDDWVSRLFPCLVPKRNTIYRPSSTDRRPRPTIEVITVIPRSDQPEDDGDVVYENVPRKPRNSFFKKVRFDKTKDEPCEQTPTHVPLNPQAREPLIPKKAMDSYMPYETAGTSSQHEDIGAHADGPPSYVNVDFSPLGHHNGRPVSGRSADPSLKPLIQTKPQVLPRPVADERPAPARRPASDAVASAGSKVQVPPRPVTVNEDRLRPSPAPRAKPRAESDTMLMQAPNLKVELNRLRKTASNEPSAAPRKPQVPRRPDSHGPLGFDSNSSPPRDNRQPGGLGAGRITEMKMLLGNQGVR